MSRIPDPRIEAARRAHRVEARSDAADQRSAVAYVAGFALLLCATLSLVVAGQF